MNLKAFISICFLVVFSATLFSQKEDSKWYFGINAGLDFTTNPPTVLTNGKTHAVEGTACVSDTSGNLLFYTSGDTIWNKAQQIMANGIGLLGTNTSDQGALIIKQPGNNNIYFIFTTDGQAHSGGLCYTTVDMSQAAGMGSVTAKNTLLNTPTAEKLTATLHCNGVDIWVSTHDMNTNVFRTYLVTAAGVNTLPILSMIGTLYNYSPPGVPNGKGGCSQGSMKFSPNGRKLALAISDLATFELYDFDNLTGIVSNSISLGTNFVQAYSVEFSPDGSKLYGTNWPSPYLYQWDLCAGSPQAVINSLYEYTSASNNIGLGGMQLAPDGKIYIVRQALGPAYLSVISNPNQGGAACNLIDQGQTIAPGFVPFVLPNFMTSFFYYKPSIPPFAYTLDTLLICLSSAAFTIPDISSVQSCASSQSLSISLTWSFGDPLSLSANTSTLANPIHVYTAPGNYQVQLIFYRACRTDTLRQQIRIPSSGMSVIIKPVSCLSPGSATVTMKPGTGPWTYSWSPSAQTNSVANNLSPGSYTVYVSYAACSLFSTVPVDGNNALSGTITTVPPFCSGTNSGSAAINLDGQGVYYYIWATVNAQGQYNYIPAAQTSSAITNIASGSYTVNVTDLKSLCVLTETFQVSAPPPVPVNISADTVCIGQTLHLYANSDAGSSYSWSGPKSFLSTQQNPVFINADASINGIYQLTVTTANGCPALDSVNALVIPRFLASATSNTPCALSTLSLFAGPALFYQWLGPDNFISSIQNPIIHNVSPSSSGTYILLSGLGSCRSRDSVSLTIHEKPEADFEIVPSNPLAGVDKVTFTNASSGLDQSEWNWFVINNSKDSLNGQRVFYMFDSAGNFPIALVVRNKWGCVDTVVKSLLVLDNLSIYVPNTFTPNDDGLNDTFQPKGAGIKSYNLVILDRWGAQLFKTNDFLTGWDGTYKGAISKTDVYIWKITVTGSDNKVRGLQGYVTLYR